MLGIRAVTWPLSKNVVGTMLPSNCTKLLALKLLPLTCKTKAAPKVATALGAMAESVGMGLMMAKFWLALLPPPGVGLAT